MKKKIKIKFVDVPREFDKKSNFVLDILRERYEVEISESPDFIFYGIFGIEYLSYVNCVRIFLNGEPVFPNFNDCDYAIGYAYMSCEDRYLRVGGILGNPLGMAPTKEMQNRNLVSPKMAGRKFCNFVYSNDKLGYGSQLRIKFCKKIMEYKHVDCPGRVLNNMHTDEISIRYKGFDSGGVPIVTDNAWEDSKVQFLKKYKFTIAFENIPLSGMTSEKLFHPFYAYSVPIYWGNPMVTREFNPKSFINCNDFNGDFDSVLKYVKELDNDNEKYLQMLSEPPLQPDYDFNQTEKLRKFLFMIIERGNKPVRNPEAVNCWETISANLVLRWGDNYQKVHYAITYSAACQNGVPEKLAEMDTLYNSNTWKLVCKLRKFGDSKLGYLPKKFFHFLLKMRKYFHSKTIRDTKG